MSTTTCNKCGGTVDPYPPDNTCTCKGTEKQDQVDEQQIKDQLVHLLNTKFDPGATTLSWDPSLNAELIPICPNCGSSMEVVSGGIDVHAVTCTDCGLAGPSGETEGEANQLWFMFLMKMAVPVLTITGDIMNSNHEEDQMHFLYQITYSVAFDSVRPDPDDSEKDMVITQTDYLRYTVAAKTASEALQAIQKQLLEDLQDYPAPEEHDGEEPPITVFGYDCGDAGGTHWDLVHLKRNDEVIVSVDVAKEPEAK